MEAADDGFSNAEFFGMTDPSASGADGSSKKKGKKKGGFAAMGLSTAIYRSVMRKGYRMPTPIQRRAIPHILAGEDVVAMARTGSGKTAAFLLPLFERLKAHSTTVGVRAVVLSPTRELALQTHKFARELSHFVAPPLRFGLLVGGDAMEEQFDELSRNPDALIATPGRMQHVLHDTQLALSRVEYLVFDEADRLFEMGFAVQIAGIMATMPDERQCLLFSATMPSILADFTRARLHEPRLIRLDLETKLSDALSVAFFKVRPHEKAAALVILLQSVLPRDQQTIVFASTRHHVEMLHELLQKAGLDPCCIYGSLDAAARKIALGKFRAGKSKLLLVTDVAARGIDVPLLDNVVNFDFPSKPKLFVHRAGRAARAGRTGRALSLVEHEELPYLVDLMLYLGRNLTPVPIGGEGATDVGGADDVELGVLPSTRLEAEVEYINGLMRETPELGALQRVATRALQMYKRTRGGASKASVGRARLLPAALGVHPLVADGLDVAAEAKRSGMLSQLKGFRPPVRDGGLAAGASVVAAVPEALRAKRQAAACKAAAAAAVAAAAAAPPTDHYAGRAHGRRPPLCGRGLRRHPRRRRPLCGNQPLS